MSQFDISQNTFVQKIIFFQFVAIQKVLSLQNGKFGETEIWIQSFKPRESRNVGQVDHLEGS